MLPLEHDARTKQQIKDTLYAVIYGPVNKHFQARIETLIARNTVLGGFVHKHFVYKGHLYNAETTQPPLKRNRLMTALRDPMEEYLSDLEQLNNQELPYVLGFLNQVLNSSSSLQDYLKVLPESIHAPINELMATCPCRIGVLSPEKAKQLQEKNADAVKLIKARLFTNLII